MMNNIKKALKIISVIVIVAVFLIPFIIHFCFSINAPNDFWSAKWEAGDMLQYAGFIISAVIAIIGIGITIWCTQKQYHDDVLNGVLPYFSIEVSKQDIDHINESDSHYINSVFVIVHNDRFQIKTKMDDKLSEIIKKAAMYNKNIGAGIATMAPKNLKILFDVVNLGKGPAISFTVSVKDSRGVEIEDGSIPINIRQSERFPVCLLINDYASNPNEIFHISYRFYNIYGTQYNQLQIITKEGTKYITESVLSQPVEIKNDSIKRR